jgi:hypothetical protein
VGVVHNAKLETEFAIERIRLGEGLLPFVETSKVAQVLAEQMERVGLAATITLLAIVLYACSEVADAGPKIASMPVDS